MKTPAGGPNALTHLDGRGRARMVDVSGKPRTRRQAVARATVLMKKKSIDLIREGRMPKGDVQAAARIAGIMAAKKTPELIPLTHPIALSQVTLDIRLDENRNAVEIESTAKTVGETGVEMEALTAACVAALTVYDMCKAVDKEAVITDVMLMEKSGGKSGTYKRKVKAKQK
ncbi:MAG: cyclic pyranopterin monophosphate synthase MoaC [Nitrospiraceae bacterium]|nr:cyclic pyranopterin monophosphate synthase MoaC [Nitrospiraceae bacterium]